MKKSLSETKVLKKLGIEDFRHLTKDKVITMMSMLDKMEPEVAKKAIEQFPHFADTMKSVLNDYKSFLDNALEKNNESVKSVYESYDKMISCLQKELDKENYYYSFEERKYLIDRMLEICKLKDNKDTENKKFIAALAILGACAIGIATAVLSANLGTNSKLGIDDNSEQE